MSAPSPAPSPVLRSVARRVAAASLVLVACSTPTALCGCPPARSAVVVTGTLHSGAGTPVAGARLHFDGVPPTMSADPPIVSDAPAVTDAGGAFVARAYSDFAPAELTIRAAVVLPATADTVRLRTGVVARFRIESALLDTVRLALRLP